MLHFTASWSENCKTVISALVVLQKKHPTLKVHQVLKIFYLIIPEVNFKVFCVSFSTQATAILNFQDISNKHLI